MRTNYVKRIKSSLMRGGVTFATWLYAGTLDCAAGSESPIANAASAPILDRGDLAANQYPNSANGLGLVAPSERGVVPMDHIRETVFIGKRKAPYFCNRSLARADVNVTRAVIVIHGSSRNATDYFDAVLAAVPGSADAPEDWRRKT